MPDFFHSFRHCFYSAFLPLVECTCSLSLSGGYWVRIILRLATFLFAVKLKVQRRISHIFNLPSLRTLSLEAQTYLFNKSFPL